MPAFFISDLHLDDHRPECVEGFLRYLGNFTAGDQLFILGDLFEAWVGDDHTSPMIDSIKAALKTCEAEIFFQHGNRDFLIGAEFARQCGLALLPDAYQLTLTDETVLLMHGDSLCTLDTDYMRIRPMLRDPEFQHQLLAKPIQERIKIAADARNESQAHTQTSDLAIMDVTPEAVIDTLNQHGVKTLIHGHTHRPFDHKNVLSQGSGRRLVLGDWGALGWHIVADEGGLTLESFELSDL